MYECTMNKQGPFPAVYPLQNEGVEFGLFVHSMIYKNFNFKISSFCY